MSLPRPATLDASLHARDRKVLHPGSGDLRSALKLDEGDRAPIARLGRNWAEAH